VIRTCFSSSTWFISSGVQRRGFGPSWVNVGYKDLALRAYESIYNWQHPRNFLNSCFVPGSRRPVIPSSLSGPIFLWPLLIKCPNILFQSQQIVTYSLKYKVPSIPGNL
jgi:hypothetical protein